jgi:hypothetical protein
MRITLARRNFRGLGHLEKGENMNALVKKEIRLLLPGWIAALLLAMVQAVTEPFNFYVAFLLFFGLTIMALTTIGREASLNTFSSLLAQPADRMRLWQIKLSVLAAAFLSVFVIWLLAFALALRHSTWETDSAENPYNLFITVCLIATATFTGGLWSTLLLRQLAGAFWLTLLVPAVLSGFTAVFFSGPQSSNLAIAVLSVVMAVYSVGGFFFARWLFFRAQDVGWTGGNIALPEWKIFARSENIASSRNSRPLFALTKKEFQLQQASLMGATGLLVLHAGIICLRKFHHFDPNSAGEILVSIFWMLWLVMAPVIGSMSVAEERRLGVMEGQLCLPVSRRVQFVLKGTIVTLLGTFLGGVMPMVLEHVATLFGAQNPVMKFGDNSEMNPAWVFLAITALSFWLSLLNFFASTLARSFLQAIGLGIAAFFISFALLGVNAVKVFQDYIPFQSILPSVIAVPVIIVTLLWLAYLNFNDFRPGWPLWRRNLLGFFWAFVLVITASAALYNRSWEVFEPAEPAHGPAKFSLANSPAIRIVQNFDLLVRLPDGRVWFDGLGNAPYDYYNGSVLHWKYLWRTLVHPLPESIGPGQFLAGSNWVWATTEHMYFGWTVADKRFGAPDFMETAGIQPDGTLWISDKPEPGKWTPGILQQYGSETNWQQIVQGRTSVVLLKSDGTLWRWGCLTNDLHQWPGLRTFTPYQIGTNSDWQKLFTMGGSFLRRADGRVWHLGVNWKTGKDELTRATNYDGVVLQTASSADDGGTAFVRADGTLWMLNRYWDEQSRQMKGVGVLRVGKDNDWREVSLNFGRMVALKDDGSLWEWHFGGQWNIGQEQLNSVTHAAPVRLGIHNDWVALANTWDSVIALAADGSVWFWPNRYQYDQYLIKLPTQPKFLGNVFAKSD